MSILESIHNSLLLVRNPFYVLCKWQHDGVERALEWESDDEASNSLPWPSGSAPLNPISSSREMRGTQPGMTQGLSGSNILRFSDVSRQSKTDFGFS